LSDGIESDFYCLEQSSFRPCANEHAVRRSLFRKFTSKLAIFINRKLTNQIHFSVFSTNAISLDFFKDLSRDKTRVLHFHNWQNSVIQFFENSKLFNQQLLDI
jgi:hypothetical protein